MRKWAVLLFGFAGVSASANGLAIPKTSPAMCSLRHDASFFTRLEQMPAVIRTDFLTHVGTIAAADEPFDPGDVAPHRYPTHRFVRGISSRGPYFTWYFIWYEHGGIGLSNHIVAYMIGRDGPTHVPVAHVMTHMTGSFCAAMDAMLDGVSAVDSRSAW